MCSRSVKRQILLSRTAGQGGPFSRCRPSVPRTFDVRSAKYRREEVGKVRSERDPIDRMRVWLLDEKVADEDELKEMDRNIKISFPTRRNSPKTVRSPIPRSSIPTLWLKPRGSDGYASRSSDAGAIADNDGR